MPWGFLKDGRYACCVPMYDFMRVLRGSRGEAGPFRGVLRLMRTHNVAATCVSDPLTASPY